MRLENVKVDQKCGTEKRMQVYDSQLNQILAVPQYPNGPTLKGRYTF